MIFFSSILRLVCTVEASISNPPAWLLLLVHFYKSSGCCHTSPFHLLSSSFFFLLPEYPTKYPAPHRDLESHYILSREPSHRETDKRRETSVELHLLDLTFKQRQLLSPPLHRANVSRGI
ncbi:hypothetical protein F4818DRAFT_24844 [Hypoxylon cercidicola]|nr:hypothetical protein F4818DRAFT_24844 [Hypoxylon cercidicola]